MALKSKDVIRMTDIGENIKDSLPLFEYRIAENLTEPMKVNQVYKKVIEKYPNDYIGGSLNFYKNIEILESKKIIEKVIIEKNNNFSNYFNDSFTEVEMSTIADDEVDIVEQSDKLRKETRRTERWFQLNKNKFNNDSDGLEIKQDKEKKLNYKHFSHLDSSNNNEEIYIPIENPFLPQEEVDEDSETITVLKKVHSNENNEGMVISFIKEEKVVVPSNKSKKNKNRTEREKYKKAIQKEQFGDKKFKKLKERKYNNFSIIKKIEYWIKKILTNR